MEQDPFAVVEALTIAGFACGAEKGFVYIRGEYPLATERLEHAIARGEAPWPSSARTSWATGSPFDIELRRGAGAYICGEETALFNSIEGKRGEPRNKPPFPVTHGVFGKPTAINNVETLINVLEVLRVGAEAYAAIGTEGSTGPRLFCLSGHVERPGVYEVEHGATLRELIELAGRRPWGRSAQGGPARRRGGRLRRTGHARREAHVRGRAGGRLHARLRRDHGLRRAAPISSTCASGSLGSSATRAAGNACRAAWARCGRKRRSIGWSRARRSAPDRTSSP